MKEIKWGAILSYLTIVSTFVVAIVYTPYMIRLLGQQEYGLYTLMMAFVGYLSILDLGLGNAIVRYIARNREAGTPAQEAKLNGLFLTLFSLIGIGTLVIGAVLYLLVPSIFGNSLNADQLEKAGIMVIIMTINFAFSFPLSVFSSILQAYEKFIVVKLTGLLKVIIQPIIMIILLLKGAGAVEMTYVVCGMGIAMLLANVIVCMIQIKPKFVFKDFDSILLKGILTYSAFIFITAIVDKIYWQTDQIFIGIFKGPSDVAVYGVAVQFIMIFMSLSLAISGLFLPKISVLVMKENGMEQVNRLFVQVGSIQYMILGFVLGGFTLFGKDFITLWVGSDYLKAYYIVLIIMIPFTIDLIQNMGLNILKAKNLFAFRTKLLIAMALLNIAISIPVIIYFDIEGTAIITALFLFIGNVIVMNIYYHKVIQLDIIGFWRKIGILTVVITLAMLIVKVIIGNLELQLSWLHLFMEISVYVIILTLGFCLLNYQKITTKWFRSE